MSWGTDPWGSGSWGSGSLLSIVAARALSTHCVEVRLSRAARRRSVLGAGDGLNPQTWTVMAGSESLTPLSVEFSAPDRCKVFTLHPFLDWRTLHTVEALSLFGEDGVLIAHPREAEFRGVLALRDQNALSGRYDLANPPVLVTSGPAGTLQSSSAGGYRQVRGAEYFKKLIFRRLTTVPGSFFHIPKGDYGLGLQIKSLLRTSDLVALKVLVEQECFKEAGVTAASARLTMLASGTLKLELQVKIENEDVATSMEIERG